MRISLQLFPQNKNCVVPINYQYPLSAAIYKILQQSSPDYAEFLHDKGYPAPSGRLMKLFTFSKLWIPNVQRKGEVLIGDRSSWRLQIGSPMRDEFVQNFVLGLFESSEIALGAQGIHAEFLVEQVEALPMAEFQETTRFKCLSPLVVSTMHERNGKLQPYYFRPEDAELSEAVRKNSLEKNEIIHGKQPEDDRLEFRLEAHDRPKSKLITLKAGTAEQTHIKAFETYFTLEGSTELMQVAWEGGLGEHGSQGFGMVEVVKSQKVKSEL